MSGVEIPLASVFLSARREALDGGPRTQALGLELLLEDGGCVMNSGLRTHLDTEVVSIPIHAGCQPLQRAQEVPNLFPGWALAVHNLEGL